MWTRLSTNPDNWGGVTEDQRFSSNTNFSADFSRDLFDALSHSIRYWQMACGDDLQEYGMGLATVIRNFVFSSVIKRRALISGIWSLLFCRCKRISWFYRLRLGNTPIGSHEQRRRSCHKHQQTQIESDKSARMRKHTDFKQIFFQISKSVMFVAAVIRFCSFTPRVCSFQVYLWGGV